MILLAIYGNQINLFDSLFISIFSMLIVFLILLIISYMIDVTAKIVGLKVKKENVVDNKKENIYVNDNTELVAIIAASVACVMNKKTDEIVIKKIKRLNNNYTSWTEKGLIDNLN